MPTASPNPAQIAINGRNHDMVAARRGRAIPAACDVTDGAAFEATMDRIAAQAGGIDILVCSAAHFLIKPMDDSTDDEIAALFGGKLLTAMRKRGWGRIVPVSNMGVIASDGLAPVDSAASGALAAFAKAISTAKDPHGVTCNVVAPGFIETEMTAPCRDDPDHSAWITSRVPRRSPGQAARDRLAGRVPVHRCRRLHHRSHRHRRRRNDEFVLEPDRPGRGAPGR